MKKGLKKFLYWLPRILAILYILFIALFALDVFGAGYSPLETVIALFMHLVPNYILIAILLPFRRGDLTASPSLQGIRSERPHLHSLCLASAATLTRE